MPNGALLLLHSMFLYVSVVFSLLYIIVYNLCLLRSASIVLNLSWVELSLLTYGHFSFEFGSVFVYWSFSFSGFMFSGLPNGISKCQVSQGMFERRLAVEILVFIVCRFWLYLRTLAVKFQIWQ